MWKAINFGIFCNQFDPTNVAAQQKFPLCSLSWYMTQLDWICHNWHIEDGVTVGGHLVNAVRFADDQAMVANSNARLQRIMDAHNKMTED